jgi:hypothetical protein
MLRMSGLVIVFVGSVLRGLVYTIVMWVSWVSFPMQPYLFRVV